MWPWRKIPRPFNEARRLWFDSVQSNQGIYCYWHCVQDDKLYRKDGEDYIYVKTQNLSEFMSGTEKGEG